MADNRRRHSIDMGAIEHNLKSDDPENQVKGLTALHDQLPNFIGKRDFFAAHQDIYEKLMDLVASRHEQVQLQALRAFCELGVPPIEDLGEVINRRVLREVSHALADANRGMLFAWLDHDVTLLKSAT